MKEKNIFEVIFITCVLLLNVCTSMNIFVTNYNFSGFVPNELVMTGLTFKADQVVPSENYPEISVCFRINIDYFNAMGQYSSFLDFLEGGVSGAGESHSKLVVF